METPNLTCIKRSIDSYLRHLKSLKTKGHSLNQAEQAAEEIAYLQGWLAALDTVVEKFTSTNKPSTRCPITGDKSKTAEICSKADECLEADESLFCYKSSKCKW